VISFLTAHQHYQKNVLYGDNRFYQQCIAGDKML